MTTSRTTTWSPRRRPRRVGRPLPGEDDLLAGLGALRHVDVLHALERRDLDRAAEHRAGDADLGGRDEVLAVALEAVVAARPTPRRRGRRPARRSRPRGPCRRRGCAARPRSRPARRPRRSAPSAGARGRRRSRTARPGSCPRRCRSGRRTGASSGRTACASPAGPRPDRRTSRRCGSACRARRRCPLQCSQRVTALKETSRLAPVRTSARSIETETPMSPPARGRSGRRSRRCRRTASCPRRTSRRGCPRCPPGAAWEAKPFERRPSWPKRS